MALRGFNTSGFNTSGFNTSGFGTRGLPEGMRRVWPLLTIRGALMALFGIVTLVWPALTAVVVISVFGAYAVIDGVITIGYGLFRRRSGTGGRGWLAQGVIAIVAGAIALFWPAATGAVVLIVLGFWALLIGVVVTTIGWQLRTAGPRFWLWPFVLGLLGVVFGLVLIFQPAEALVALTTILGVMTLLSGSLLVYGGLRLRTMQLT